VTGSIPGSTEGIVLALVRGTELPYSARPLGSALHSSPLGLTQCA
jgi:hypothetical protein